MNDVNKETPETTNINNQKLSSRDDNTSKKYQAIKIGVNEWSIKNP